MMGEPGHERPSPLAVVAAVALAGAVGVAGLVRGRTRGPDTAWWDRRGPRLPGRRGLRLSRQSLYLKMRDGVRIAADVYLPRDLAPSEKLPTILRQTRYYRRMEFRQPFGALIGHPYSGMVRRFVGAGYAWVAIDVRGTGASFGSRQLEWSPDEVRDAAEVVDWIIAQPWSDGRVAATGISYEGTSAEMLASTRHPALKAISPRFSHFDSYADIGFPGGIRMSKFAAAWPRANRALDRGHPEELAGWSGRLLGARVAAVDADPDRSLVAAAIRDHAGNYDLAAISTQIACRDDAVAGSVSSDAISPYARTSDVEATGIPVYSFSGWYDGGNTRGAISRYLTLRNPGSRLTLGPWPHAGVAYLAPFVAPRPTGFDQVGELLRFLDYHLKGAGGAIGDELPVHYFTMGENLWKAAASWPPPADIVPHFFDVDGSLSLARPADPAGHDVHHVDPTAGSGNKARWDSMYMISGEYPDRAAADRKLLTFTSPPLDADLEVTGHPLVTLYVASTATDGQFFVYLEDVAPDGRVGYVVEGLLRGIHRMISDDPPYRTPVAYHSCRRADLLPLVPGEVAELRIDLLPVSYLFQRGHRIRVALAGADRDHCEPLSGDPPTLHVFRGGDRASRIELPVVPAA